MARLSPTADDRRMIDAGEGISSSFGGEGGVYAPVIERAVSGDVLEDDDDDDSSSVSDCESVISGSGNVDHVENVSIEINGLVRLDEGDKLHGIIEKKFVSRLSDIGINVHVQYIHRNMFNVSAIAQAKVSSFQIYTKAVEKRNGGDANVKYAWFGASKDQINNIILHGFGYDNIQKNGFSDHGVVLSADHSPLESVHSAIADEDGVKHIILCRVLLGKSELVNRCSTQSHPSSEEFQSGVDDLVSPKKYIVWSSQMNTHILPEFVISFKTLANMNSKSYQEYLLSINEFHHVTKWFQLIIHAVKYDPGPTQDGVHVERPVSPWIPIPDLIAALSKILPPKAIKEMTQIRRSYIEHKISRSEMIRGIRKITGDRMLIMVLKNFTEKRRCNGFR